MGDYLITEEKTSKSTSKDSLESYDNMNSSAPKETSYSTLNIYFMNTSTPTISTSLKITTDSRVKL